MIGIFMGVIIADNHRASLIGRGYIICYQSDLTGNRRHGISPEGRWESDPQQPQGAEKKIRGGKRFGFTSRQ